MRIAFLHGWAFDRTLWDPVIARLPGHACHADDRGYFGPAEARQPADLAVTHSAGTLRALAAPPPGCRAILAINGFDCFAARPDFITGVPARMIGRMLARLTTDAQGTASEFRRRCGAAPPLPVVDSSTLQADLALLRDADLRGRWAGPLMLLCAADDPIVSCAHAAATFTGLAPGQRRMLPAGGHLLPLTAPDACAAAILEMAESLA